MRRLLIPAVYGLLLAAQIPWYEPAGSPPDVWWGLPRWVWLTLSAQVATAVFTVYAARRAWDADPAGE